MFTRIGRDETGIAIVEVLVSALLLLIFSVGVYTLLTGATRATAQERHRAQANTLAQQELDRVRSLRIADLVSLNSTRRVLDDGTQVTGACPTSGPQSQLTCYTVTSQSQFQDEPAATNGCSAGTGSHDYLLLTISVSWTGMGALHPVKASTIVSPPSGSLVPNSGSILVNVVDANNVGISGVALSGSGPGSFSGSTGPTGCVLWRNLPVGTYTMAVGGAATTMVDKEGNAPTPQTVSVVDQGTNTINLMYDRPGALSVSLKTLSYSGTLVNSSADGISAKAPLMNQPKTFTSAKTSPITTTQALFPYASPTTYSVYAGTCASNNPDPSQSGANPLAFANVTVPAGATGTTPDNTIQLPALQLTVYSGSSASTPGSPVQNATVTVKDLNCAIPVRTFTTNASGQLPDPGLPYGSYEVCAQATISSIQRRNYVRSGTSKEAVPVQNPTAGTIRAIYLDTTAVGVTTGTGATCP